jgi:hypothetical protein
LTPSIARFRVFLILVAGAVAASTRPLPAACQTPSPSVSLGFGVDTTISDVRSIFGLVRAYLAKPDSSSRSRGLWSGATDSDPRLGDVAAGLAYQGFPATIVGVIPAMPGDSVYIVKILHARTDSTRHVQPIALQRLFAIRESESQFGFRLASALPRLTSAWQRRTEGRITFWYEPGLSPNPAKIHRAAQFVDSVTRLFGVAPAEHFNAYIGSSYEDVLRAIGLDFFTQASGSGEGRGGLNLGKGILLIGNPAIGEAYDHEFVHSVLNHFPAGNALTAEGVATWLGGSQGRTPRQMYQLLNDYLRNHPEATLAELLNSGVETGAKLGTDLRYATGALVAESLYRKQRIAGVRSFYQQKGDTATLLNELANQLELPKSETIDNWWRKEAARASENR